MNCRYPSLTQSHSSYLLLTFLIFLLVMVKSGTGDPPPQKDLEVNAWKHNERFLQFIVEGILNESEAWKLYIDPAETAPGWSIPEEGSAWHAVYPPLPPPGTTPPPGEPPRKRKRNQ